MTLSQVEIEAYENYAEWTSLIQTKVISIWRALGALSKENSFLHNSLPLPSRAIITTEASCFENLFFLVSPEVYKAMGIITSTAFYATLIFHFCLLNWSTKKNQIVKNAARAGRGKTNFWPVILNTVSAYNFGRRRVEIFS